MTRLVDLYRRETVVWDLFSGAGGVGLALETLDIPHIGFDIEDKSKKYPGPFCEVDCSDASNFPALPEPDVVWVSPPCSAYSTADVEDESDAPTFDELNVREVISALDPDEYIIENVPGCHDLEDPVRLDGLALADGRYKLERWFETSFDVPDALGSGEPEWTMHLDEPQGRRKRPIAEAKMLPETWTRSELRSAITQEYVQYLMHYCPAVGDVPLPPAVDTRQNTLDSHTRAGDDG